MRADRARRIPPAPRPARRSRAREHPLRPADVLRRARSPVREGSARARLEKERDAVGVRHTAPVEVQEVRPFETVLLAEPAAELRRQIAAQVRCVLDVGVVADRPVVRVVDESPCAGSYDTCELLDVARDDRALEVHHRVPRVHERHRCVGEECQAPPVVLVIVDRARGARGRGSARGSGRARTGSDRRGAASEHVPRAARSSGRRQARSRAWSRSPHAGSAARSDRSTGSASKLQLRRTSSTSGPASRRLRGCARARDRARVSCRRARGRIACGSRVHRRAPHASCPPDGAGR